MAKELWQIVAENARKNLGGRPNKFKTATDLLDAFIEYCRWVNDNPILTSDGIRNRDGEKTTTAERIQRPMSIDGFCAFAGIGNWTQLKKDNSGRDGFRSIFGAVERTIRENQISGGMVGIYNASLTARLNGLADNHEIESSGGIVVNINKGAGLPARTTENDGL